MTSIDDIRLIDMAIVSRGAGCMHALGFSGWTSDSASIKIPNAKNDIDFIDYLDPAAAARNGYTPGRGPNSASPIGKIQAVNPMNAKEKAATDAYLGIGAKTSTGRPIPKGGCSAQGEKEVIGDGRLASDPRSLQSIARTSAMQDSRVKSAIQKWSLCMTAKGFHYNSPVNSEFFGPWSTRSPDGSPSKTELRVAGSDAKCRQAVNLVGIYKSAEIAYQQARLDANLPSLKKSLAKFSQWTKSAKAIVG